MNLHPSELRDIPCYHPYITTPEQVVQVMGKDTGNFLIRNSFSQPNGLTISVRHPKGPFHMKLERTPDGCFQLIKGLSFSSLQQLLTYFSIHPIPNVEKLDSIYLSKGIECTRSKKERTMLKSKSLESSLKNQCSIDSHYIHPNNRPVDRDDGFEDDYYISSKQVYQGCARKEDVLKLPGGWEAVIEEEEKVVYKDGEGNRASELPYEIFTQLSDWQFKRLKRCFKTDKKETGSQSSGGSSSPLAPPKPLITTPTSPNTPNNNIGNNRNNNNNSNISTSKSNNGTAISPESTLKFTTNSNFFMKGNSVYARMSGGQSS